MHALLDEPGGVPPAPAPHTTEGESRSEETTEIIEQTKDLLPSRRVPDEFDVVELLTNRNIEALGVDAVAGQAECIGGAA